MEENEWSLWGLEEIEEFTHLKQTPWVKVKFEKDKLLCVLRDSISFEPDIIKSVT